MFCLSFVVAFQKQELEKKKKSPKQSKKVKKEIKPEEPLDPKFIDCSQVFKSMCHIEYTLHKGLSYGIDVACWGRVAKIYTNQEVIRCRSFQVDDLSVVCFSIMHAGSDSKFEVDDINELFTFTVTFKFNEDKNSFMPLSKSDNPKFFYDFKKPSNSTDQFNQVEIEFCNVYETTAGVVPDFIKVKEVTFSEMEKIVKNEAGGNFVHKMSCIPSTFHKKILVKLIQELSGKRKSFTEKQMEKIPEDIQNIAKDKKSKNTKDKKNKNTKDKKSKNTKDKKGKGKKVIDPDQNTIKFSGGQLLIDRVYDVHEKFNLSPALPYVAVIYSLKDILKRDVKLALIPFSVIIKKIYNLPPTELRITKVFLKYSLNGIINEPIETEKVEVKNYAKININHAKMFVMPSIKLPELVESIQTSQFFIKVYGICKKQKNQISKVYGQGDLDNCIGFSHTDRYNMPLVNKKNAFVNNATSTQDDDGTVTYLLAHTSADFTQITNAPLWLRVHCNLTSRSLKIYDPANFCYKKEETPSSVKVYNFNFLHFNPLNINEDKFSNVEETYYKESDLCKHASSIKVMAKIDIELKPRVLSECLQSPECYSRTVLIVRDQNLASSLLAGFILINENIGGIEDAKVTSALMPSLISVVNGVIDVPQNVNVQSSYQDLPMEKSVDKMASSTSDTVSSATTGSTSPTTYSQHTFVTGFAIDCVDKTIMMIEGLRNSTFPRVMTHIFRLNPGKAKVLYQSDLVFTERIYKSFLPQRKIAIITMAEKLSLILSSSHAYLEGNVPIPAWQALLKLDLLSKSDTISAIIRNNLLPTPDELMSFDLEFGIPVQTISDTTQNKHRCLYRSRKNKN